MFLKKVFGKGGDWLIEEKKDWPTLKYFTTNKIPLNGEEIPCYCFTKENKDGTLEPVVFPVDEFPSIASMFLVPNQEYVIFIVTQTMIDFWNKKYSLVPEEKWPVGLKDMLVEQVLLFQVVRIVEKV